MLVLRDRLVVLQRLKRLDQSVAKPRFVEGRIDGAPSMKDGIGTFPSMERVV